MTKFSTLSRFKARAQGAALATLLALCASPAAWAVKVGEPAPALELPGTRGLVSLAKLQGKVVYVDFWASWCGPCKQSFPWMNEMQAKYGPKGFQILAVNVDSNRADAEKFLAEVPANFIIALDAKGEAPKSYDIKGMPSSVLVGPDGRVIATHAGFKPEDRKSLEDTIAAAVGAAGK